MKAWGAVLVFVVLWGFRVDPPAWLCGLVVIGWLLVDLRYAELERRRDRRATARAAAARSARP